MQRIEIPSDMLKTALKGLGHVRKSKTQNLLDDQVWFHAEGGLIRIEGTVTGSGEAMRSRLDWTGTDQDHDMVRVGINVRRVEKFARALEKGDKFFYLHIDKENQKATLKAENAGVTVTCMEFSEDVGFHPLLSPNVKDVKMAWNGFGAKWFALASKRLGRFYTDEKSRFELYGLIMMDTPGKGLRLFATDGRAMAIQGSPEGRFEAAEPGFKSILPHNVIEFGIPGLPGEKAGLIYYCDDAGEHHRGTWELSGDNGKYSFEFRCAGKPYGGTNVPDCVRIENKTDSGGDSFKVEKKPLADRLRKASSLLDNPMGAAEIRLSGNEARFFLKDDKDTGAVADCAVQIHDYHGEPLDTYLNQYHVRDFAEVAASDCIEITPMYRPGGKKGYYAFKFHDPEADFTALAMGMMKPDDDEEENAA